MRLGQVAASHTGQFVKPLLDRARRESSSGNGGGRQRRDRRGTEATAL